MVKIQTIQVFVLPCTLMLSFLRIPPCAYFLFAWFPIVSFVSDLLVDYVHLHLAWFIIEPSVCSILGPVLSLPVTSWCRFLLSCGFRLTRVCFFWPKKFYCCISSFLAWPAVTKTFHLAYVISRDKIRYFKKSFPIIVEVCETSQMWLLKGSSRSWGQKGGLIPQGTCCTRVFRSYK